MNKLLAALLLILSTISFAADTAGDFTASADVQRTCDLQIDDMNFGDVSLQSYVGNGDVTASTNLNLRCSKNTPVNFTTNNGINGSDGESWQLGLNYKVQVAEYDSGTKQLATGIWYDVSKYTVRSAYEQNTIATRNLSIHNSFVNYNPDTSTVIELTGLAYSGWSGSSNFSSSPISSFSNGTRTLASTRSRTTWRIVLLDNNIIPNGYTLNPGTSNMISGQNEIPYSLSTTPNGTVKLNSELSNPLTYNQNDGDWQTFPLYGFANFNKAPVGVYVDTNTVTVNF